MNHHYTREERLRLADIDGIDYLPPNSAVFRRWLAKQPHRRAAPRSAPPPPQACRSLSLLPRALVRRQKIVYNLALMCHTRLRACCAAGRALLPLQNERRARCAGAAREQQADCKRVLALAVPRPLFKHWWRAAGPGVNSRALGPLPLYR